jgi:hypothetical protein
MANPRDAVDVSSSMSELTVEAAPSSIEAQVPQQGAYPSQAGNRGRHLIFFIGFYFVPCLVLN